VQDDEELLDLLRGGQRVFNVVALSGVKGDVDAAIVKIVGTPTPDEVGADVKGSLSHSPDRSVPAVRPAHLA
jgi:hypothetical protein